VDLFVVLHVQAVIWVFLDDLVDQLLLTVVEILEVLLDMVLDLLGGKRREVWMGHKLFKVAEFMFQL